MPSATSRAKFLESLKDKWQKRRRFRFLRWLLDEDNNDLFDPLDVLQERRLELDFIEASNRRYTAKERGKYRELETYRRIEMFLSDEGERPCLNAEEFKNEFGMSRSSFWTSHDLIKDDDQFKSRADGSGRHQMPVSHQQRSL